MLNAQSSVLCIEISLLGGWEVESGETSGKVMATVVCQLIEVRTKEAAVYLDPTQWVNGLDVEGEGGAESRRTITLWACAPEWMDMVVTGAGSLGWGWDMAVGDKSQSPLIHMLHRRCS